MFSRATIALGIGPHSSCRLECGPMLNVMASLPNRWRPLFNLQSLADAYYYIVLCSDATNTRNPLKFAGVPQTPEPISAISRPKFTIL